MRFTLSIAAPIVLLAALAAGSEPPKDRERSDFFEKRIRPVLISKCLSCHGEKKQESGLRLDTRAAVLKGGERGAAVILGNAAGSRLMQAVRYEDDDLQMPPDNKLTQAEVDALARWIQLSLPWPENTRLHSGQDANKPHWAFEPVQRPQVPGIQNVDWAKTAIDRFISARLEAGGISPSPQVDRRTFIRRATFDLLGLPPTPDEVDTFLKDSSPDAIAHLIDRLLASPRYGERWGRRWLDVARYADNKGYVFFEDSNYPWAYTYRDYVIRALNADLPYDQFVREQIAADQLDLGDNQRPLTAMGFLTLGGHFMNNTHDIIDDRIDVVTRGLMGLTVTCARCHDHKYDPIPQADYYSLYGVFRSSYEPTVHPLFQAPPDSGEYRKFAAEMAKREKALVDFVTTKHRELVTGARQRVDEYLKAANARRGVPPADNFMLLVEKGDINPAMLLRWQRYLENPRRVHDEVWRPWRELGAASAETFNQEASSVVEGDAPLNPILRKRLAASPPNSMDELADLYAGLLRDMNAQWLAVLKQAGEAGEPAPKQLADQPAEQLRQTLYGPDAPADAPLQMDWGFLSLFPDRPTQGEYKALLKAVEEWSATGAGAPPRAMVLYDAELPHEPRIFQRGQPNRLGDFVPRQFVAVASSDRKPFAHGSGRRELADAIVDPGNPLTARVIVNRVWMHHFGRGLVPTPSDFGLRSEPPSHPNLLDYLATEFMERGWSIKELHRAIMTSAVYQQESLDREDGLQIDPENRLLWKMNRRRLDFESLRDSVLTVSGGLTAQMYGKPVDLFGADQSKPRRSIYGFINRMDVSPLLTTFDFPNPIASSAGRVSTTVPPQALYLMNNKFAADAASRLMRRFDNAKGEVRIAAIYQLLFARQPTTDELAVSHSFLGKEPDEAAWSRYVHGLLMTNEFMFID
jgi:hypothetical protein